jgi:hypothetical protein
MRWNEKKKRRWKEMKERYEEMKKTHFVSNDEEK